MDREGSIAVVEREGLFASQPWAVMIQPLDESFKSFNPRLDRDRSLSLSSTSVQAETGFGSEWTEVDSPSVLSLGSSPGSRRVDWSLLLRPSILLCPEVGGGGRIGRSRGRPRSPLSYCSCRDGGGTRGPREEGLKAGARRDRSIPISYRTYCCTTRLC